jgi:hypothetical protein
MGNNLYLWLAMSLALLVMPAAQAQVPNSVQFYTEHPTERRATEMRCYQQGATGTKIDLDCDNAQRASAAVLASEAAKRAARPEQDPASPSYWRLMGPRFARSELDQCMHPPHPNPLPTPPEYCEAAAVSLLGKTP